MPFHRSVPFERPRTGGERTPESLAALIERVSRQRDRDAFAALFWYFAPRLKTFFQRRGLDEAMAEDLAQETMLRVWHHAEQFDPSRAAPAAWVFGIARNQRSDVLRRELRRTPDLDLPEPYVSEASPEAAAIHAQREARLREALHRLPLSQQEAVRTAYLNGMSHNEAHQALGIALGTLKSRLRLALARLRDAMGESS